MKKEKKCIIQKDAVNSSDKNICIRFLTLRKISKKECACQKLQEV